MRDSTYKRSAINFLRLTRITILRLAVADAWRSPYTWYPRCVHACKYGERVAPGLCMVMFRCAYDAIPNRRSRTKEKEKIETRGEVDEWCDQLTPHSRETERLRRSYISLWKHCRIMFFIKFIFIADRTGVRPISDNEVIKINFFPIDHRKYSV